MRETAERLAGISGALGVPRDGTGLRRGLQNLAPGRTAVGSRGEAQAANLADTARAAALDLLGDTDGAVALAERRLRSGAGAETNPSESG